MILLRSHDAGAGDGRWSEHAAPARVALSAEDRAPRDDGEHADWDTPVAILVKGEPGEQGGGCAFEIQQESMRSSGPATPPKAMAPVSQSASPPPAPVVS